MTEMFGIARSRLEPRISRTPSRTHILIRVLDGVLDGLLEHSCCCPRHLEVERARGIHRHRTRAARQRTAVLHGGAARLNLARGLRCPICDAPTPRIAQGEGEELELDRLELED